MKRQKGFSLIELAIVLVIVTILIGGLAVPLSAQIEARRIGETRKTMEEARESLVGYAMTHFCRCVYSGVGVGGVLVAPPTTTCTVGCPNTNPSASFTTLRRHYLPCPDTDFDGKENRTANSCDSPRGLFPFADLGTAAQDAWGNHLHYSLTAEYGNSSTGFGMSNSPANKEVCSTSAGGCLIGTVATTLPVVLISYGPNGWGGRNVNGTTLASPSSDDEKENTDADNSYVSRSPTKSDASAGEFDDLVEWIPSTVLISRVCLGGCP